MENSKSAKLKKNLGLKIKQYRKKLGLSQAELAELVKLEIKSLSRIEAGHNYPMCENLTAIAEALNIEPWQLYYDDSDQNLEKMKKQIINSLENDKNLITSVYQYIQLKEKTF